MPRVDRTLIVDQIKRFSALPGWRDLNQAGRTELADMLESEALNPYHARSTVTLWLAENCWLPSPAQIKSTAAAAPRVEPAKATRGQCSLCRGSGRESYWALITTERWASSGDVRRRICQRIPPTPGRENLYHVERPMLEAEVDGDTQRIAMVSGFCHCEYGRHLATIQRSEDAA